jgi:hypothetical protein
VGKPRLLSRLRWLYQSIGGGVPDVGDGSVGP